MLTNRPTRILRVLFQNDEIQTPEGMRIKMRRAQLGRMHGHPTRELPNSYARLETE